MQKKIFEATRIGNLELKNRLWRSATWLNMADEKGHLSTELITCYEELAQGGVGTIITGYANIIEEEQPNAGMLGIYSDDFIEEAHQVGLGGLSEWMAESDRVIVFGPGV